MVRGIFLASLWVFIPSFAFGETYQWINRDHACIVESATGLIPGELDGRKAAYEWTNAPKSFRVQVSHCYQMPSGLLSQEGCWAEGETIARTPNLRSSVDGKHDGWRSSNRTIYNSMDGFQTLALLATGRFDFAQYTVAGVDNISWSTVTGSCTPFDE